MRKHLLALAAAIQFAVLPAHAQTFKPSDYGSCPVVVAGDDVSLASLTSCSAAIQAAYAAALGQNGGTVDLPPGFIFSTSQINVIGGAYQQANVVLRGGPTTIVVDGTPWNIINSGALGTHTIEHVTFRPRSRTSPPPAPHMGTAGLFFGTGDAVVLDDVHLVGLRCGDGFGCVQVGSSYGNGVRRFLVRNFTSDATYGRPSTQYYGPDGQLLRGGVIVIWNTLTAILESPHFRCYGNHSGYYWPSGGQVASAYISVENGYLNGTTRVINPHFDDCGGGLRAYGGTPWTETNYNQIGHVIVEGGFRWGGSSGTTFVMKGVHNFVLRNFTFNAQEVWFPTIDLVNVENADLNFHEWVDWGVTLPGSLGVVKIAADSTVQNVRLSEPTLGSSSSINLDAARPQRLVSTTKGQTAEQVETDFYVSAKTLVKVASTSGKVAAFVPGDSPEQAIGVALDASMDSNGWRTCIVGVGGRALVQYTGTAPTPNACLGISPITPGYVTASLTGPCVGRAWREGTGGVVEMLVAYRAVP